MTACLNVKRLFSNEFSLFEIYFGRLNQNVLSNKKEKL